MGRFHRGKPWRHKNELYTLKPSNGYNYTPQPCLLPIRWVLTITYVLTLIVIEVANQVAKVRILALEAGGQIKVTFSQIIMDNLDCFEEHVVQLAGTYFT